MNEQTMMLYSLSLALFILTGTIGILAIAWFNNKTDEEEDK